MANPFPHKIGAFFDDLGQEEALSRQKWWVLLRWLLLMVVVLTTLIGNRLIRLNIPIHVVLWLCAFLVIINAISHHYFFFIKKKDPYLYSRLSVALTYAQFTLDWLFITLIFHYTGSIASPFLFYFLFHVILSGVLLEKRSFLLYVTVIALTINILSLLELGRYLPHQYGASFISPEVQDNVFFVVMLLLFCTTALYVSSLFVARMLKQSRKKISKLLALQKELEQTNERLGLLNQLARDTNLALGLQPRLELICRSVTRMMGLKGVAIRLLDEKNNRLELVAACGLSEDYIYKGPVDADKSLAKALEGEPHFVLDATTDLSVQYPEAARKEGIVSMFAFPLRGREKVIGTMRLYTGERRSLSRDEIDFVAALSNQSSISIENAKIYDTLERQDEAKSDFILVMTHELKGPLMAIQSLLEVMLKGYVGSLAEKQQQIIERIYKRIDSVMEVSTGLLDSYEWESRRPNGKRVPLSMKEQMHRVVDLFKASAEEKGLTMDLSLPEEDPILVGTEDEMEKIFNNLVTNAIKYTPSGGYISLALSVSEDRLIAKVKDTGIGIGVEDIPNIFDDFYRTREAKKIDPYGRGMGLPFVKRIVETLGGTITAKSDLGKGTEFVITFPVIKGTGKQQHT